jgi:hypothetical protein
MDLSKKEWNVVDKIDLLQDTNRWVGVVSDVKRLRVTQNAGNSWIAKGLSASQKCRLHKVSYFTNSWLFITVWYQSLSTQFCRSRFSRRLRRGSSAARLLGWRVRIPPRPWISVSFECCVLSGRGLCVGLITRPEESYRGWRVWVCISKSQQWVGLGPLGAVEQWKTNECTLNYARFEQRHFVVAGNEKPCI